MSKALALVPIAGFIILLVAPRIYRISKKNKRKLQWKKGY